MALSTLDTVRPIGMEVPADGGSQTAVAPTAINTLQDGIAAAGFFVDGPSVAAADKSTYVDRTAGGLRLTDQSVSRLLSDLMTAAGTDAQSHASSRDLQHFLAGEGPGPGFASGCFLTRNFSGPILTGETWFTSSAMTTKIVSRTLAYAAGSPIPSSCTWQVFSPAGAVLRTLTDTYQYAFGSVACTGSTRTWS